MATGDEITLDTVKTRLEKAKAKYPKRPPIDPIYEYLEALYRLHRRFGEPGKGHPIFEFFNSKYKRLGHRGILYSYFRVMVDMTVPEGTRDQYKSLYANALQYAFHRGIQSKKVVKFMLDKGGYKACDRLYRKAHPKRKKRGIAKNHKQA